MAIHAVMVKDFPAIVTGGIVIRITIFAQRCIAIAVIFAYPVAAMLTMIGMVPGAVETPVFIQIFDMLEVVRIVIFITALTP